METLPGQFADALTRIEVNGTKHRGPLRPTSRCGPCLKPRVSSTNGEWTPC